MKYMEDNRDKLVTVADIEEFLDNEGLEVNVSTIYRFLNRLCDGGEAIKYVAKKGAMSSFQYVGSVENTCQDHIHLQCTSCGSIIHLECHFMDEIKEHILKDNQFLLQCEASVLYGLCKSCQEAGV